MTGIPAPADTARPATVSGDGSAAAFPEASDHGGTRDGPPVGPSRPPGGRDHGGRAERTLGAALPVLLAAGVFAVAFVHVHDVARWAGQPDWASWLIAVSVELMALASIVEIRHRHRVCAGVGWPVVTLLSGIGMSEAANLAAAGPHALTGDPGAWIPTMALWPVAAFGLVAGLKATRPTRPTSPATRGRHGHPATRTHDDRAVSAPLDAHRRDIAAPPPSGTSRHDGPSPVPDYQPGDDIDRSDRSTHPGAPDTARPALPADLVEVGRDVAAELTRSGRPVTRTALARGVRARGQRCSTDRAALLLAAVRPADDGTRATQTKPAGKHRHPPAAPGPGPTGINTGAPDD